MHPHRRCSRRGGDAEAREAYKAAVSGSWQGGWARQQGTAKETTLDAKYRTMSAKVRELEVKLGEVQGNVSYLKSRVAELESKQYPTGQSSSGERRGQ
jgi:hypothetical protein